MKEFAALKHIMKPLDYEKMIKQLSSEVILKCEETIMEYISAGIGIDQIIMELGASKPAKK